MSTNLGRGVWWPMHLACWFPLTFAGPFFVVLRNSEDIVVSVPLAAAALAVLCLSLTGLSTVLAARLDPAWRRRSAIVLLAMGMVMALQGNVVHEMFYYGEFDGNAVNWRRYGVGFWLELAAFSLALGLIPAALLKLRRVPWPIQWLPVASCALLLIPAVFSYLEKPAAAATRNFDASVFEFSAERNLIHLLPDGLQGDLVRQVLDQNPGLARAFTGFTLFTDHLGMYQGTAPSVPVLLTGRSLALRHGQTVAEIREFVREQAYPNRLTAAGFRLDYVGGSTVYCPVEAASCVARPFNDLKSRGYSRFHAESLGYAVRLVADLTLFRLSPMYLKEKIYDGGNWFLSDTTADGSSPFPDPVLREWRDHMRVVNGAPRFKFYHYIGTHLPAQWDRECRFLRNLEHNRQTASGQTHCVLKGLAAFLDRLRQRGIYDQTAIVITGDHGTNVAPDDLVGRPADASLYPNVIGHARPALLVKRIGSRDPLAYSTAPTSLIDVAATALSLVGLDGGAQGHNAFTLPSDRPRTRRFRIYDPRKFWRGAPVPFTEYAVDGPAHAAANWQLQTIFTPEPAPSRFVSFASAPAAPFTSGLGLAPGSTPLDETWVKSHQAAFLLQAADRDPTRGHRVLLTLHIPEFVAGQQLSLRVNGHRCGPPRPLTRSTAHWQQITLPIPRGMIEAGNNLIMLDFDVVGADSTGFRASALLREISLD